MPLSFLTVLLEEYNEESVQRLCKSISRMGAIELVRATCGMSELLGILIHSKWWVYRQAALAIVGETAETHEAKAASLVAITLDTLLPRVD